MILEGISGGSFNRLKRIQELKKYTEKEALEFAITCGWLAAEKQAYIKNRMNEIEKEEKE